MRSAGIREREMRGSDPGLGRPLVSRATMPGSVSIRVCSVRHWLRGARDRHGSDDEAGGGSGCSGARWCLADAGIG